MNTILVLPQFHMRSAPWRKNLSLALEVEKACKNASYN